MRAKYYITTAIDYCNDVIHVGHAYQKVVADVYARYHRLIGDRVFFLTGTDEYGSKAEQTAKEQHLTPKELVDKVSVKDKEQLTALQISYDRFIRTTDKDHTESVQTFWKKSKEKGDIYLGDFTGYYCVGCESYVTESDLVDGLCPYHKKKPIQLTEKNYFFRWSKYRSFLTKHIQSHSLFVLPEKRRNEMLSFLEKGLSDIPISRTSVSWGIPVPDSPGHVVYVWFDALINYLTGAPTGYWPADLHLLGLDNVRFHALLWPAMLESAGYELPKTVYGHGFFTLAGQKISKSLGNIIRPTELTSVYGSDAVRYYLLKIKPLSDDGDISLETLRAMYHGDLSNGLGNIVLRLTKLAETLRLKGLEPRKEHVFQKPSSKKAYRAFLEYRPHETVQDLAQRLKDLDKRIEEDKPWELLKTSPQRATEKIRASLEELYELAVLLEPFIPSASHSIQSNLTASRIETKPPLFPRLP
ncbi:MAG TPA: methionine--tRNA ligase [Patescibacteria group bacterium]|nr:methionine--tRNA ligase [Patescibacteria group bacterium]